MPKKNDFAKQLGIRIRDLRREKDVTLIELSEGTGVAQATLSRIETGLMPGTVESHQKIAETLGISLAQLYEGIDKRYGKIEHQRAATKRKIVGKSGEVRYELLTQEISKKKITPFLVTVAAHGKSGTEQLEPGVEKFIFVLDGEIKIEFDSEVCALAEHDTVYFDASIPHRMTNTTGRAVKLICAVSAGKA